MLPYPKPWYKVIKMTTWFSREIVYVRSELSLSYRDLVACRGSSLSAQYFMVNSPIKQIVGSPCHTCELQLLNVCFYVLRYISILGKLDGFSVIGLIPCCMRVESDSGAVELLFKKTYNLIKKIMIFPRNWQAYPDTAWKRLFLTEIGSNQRMFQDY